MNILIYKPEHTSDTENTANTNLFYYNYDYGINIDCYEPFMR